MNTIDILSVCMTVLGIVAVGSVAALVAVLWRLAEKIPSGPQIIEVYRGESVRQVYDMRPKHIEPEIPVGGSGDFSDLPEVPDLHDDSDEFESLGRRE